MTPDVTKGGKLVQTGNPTESDVNFLEFWGKAQPRHDDEGPCWHPLAYHCLDVAAVGEALMERHRGLRDSLHGHLGLPAEAADTLICFLLCLHDIGKFAKRFQAKVPDRYPACFGDDANLVSSGYDHGAGGLRLFMASPSSFGLPGETTSRVWRPLVSAVTGHHGSPPEPGGATSLDGLRPDFGKKGIEAAHSFIQAAQALFCLPQDLPTLDRDRVRRMSFALAGLAVLADWIGSNQQWFRYRNAGDFDSLEAYRAWARERADQAIINAGVLPARTRYDDLAYGELIGEGVTPSPMQKWAERVELPTGPTLFMIEDETGSGKTEAAIMIAHRLMKADRLDGLYMALPTMATANAMFDRLSDAHRRLFGNGEQPSISLAHGARELHAGFRSATLRGGRDESNYSNTGGATDESETTASTACAAWIADDRRRSFLADVGAGTVDQALLAVLPSRFQSLRLLGLMRRVLVLDEVHAYDAYMRREIEALLEFQAGLGGSAILLSATLPLSIRKRLSDAFARGLGQKEFSADVPDEGKAYPLATIHASGVQTFTGVPGRPGLARRLPVRFLRHPDEALDEVEEAARDGRAVLYVRNTVDDALDAHATLTARGLDPDLFHARFALADRLDKEEQIIRTFGKNSESEQRAGRILIATQVVEQSLDLDFDALVTDLAPIDLLIQRAGRLWRHQRKERQGTCELLVVAPPANDDADEDWYSQTFPRAQYVYQDHARLWLSAKVLEKVDSIESPGGLRHLVETVYGDDADETVPDALKSRLWDAEGRAGAERGISNTNVLKFVNGYRRTDTWNSDVLTPTRLVDDPQRTLRLATVVDGCIKPYAWEVAPDEPWRAWRLSEVNVSARRAGGEAIPPELGPGVDQAKTGWSRYDEDNILVILGRIDSSPLSGQVRSPSGGTSVWVNYSRDRGLTFNG